MHRSAGGVSSSGAGVGGGGATGSGGGDGVLGDGAAQFLLNHIPQVAGFGGVQLGDGDDLGLGGQHGAEFPQLGVEHPVVAGRVVGQAVDEVDIHPRALGVAQELVAQADAAVGAFQQAGNFHHHKILPGVADHAQGRLNGGERIIGDFRAGGGAAGNQG